MSEAARVLINDAFNRWRPAEKHPTWTLNQDSVGNWHVCCPRCDGEWDAVIYGDRVAFFDAVVPTDPDCES